MVSSSNAADPVVRPPKQDRSRRTLQRILDAALELFEENGVEDTSVSQIVKQARSSVGSFYGRFEGKDDLVRFLHRQLWEDAEARWWQRESEVSWTSLAPGDRVDQLVRIFLDVARQDYAVRSALAQDSALTDDDRAQAVRFDAEVQMRFAHHLNGSDTPVRPISFAAALTLAAARDHLAGRLLPDEDLQDDRFADELSLVLSSYLQPVFEGVLAEEAARGAADEATVAEPADDEAPGAGGSAPATVVAEEAVVTPTRAPVSEPASAPEPPTDVAKEVEPESRHAEAGPIAEPQPVSPPEATREAVASSEAEATVEVEPTPETNVTPPEAEATDDDEGEVDFFDVWG